MSLEQDQEPIKVNPEAFKAAQAVQTVSEGIRTNNESAEPIPVVPETDKIYAALRLFLIRGSQHNISDETRHLMIMVMLSRKVDMINTQKRNPTAAE